MSRERNATEKGALRSSRTLSSRGRQATSRHYEVILSPSSVSLLNADGILLDHSHRMDRHGFPLYPLTAFSCDCIGVASVLRFVDHRPHRFMCVPIPQFEFEIGNHSISFDLEMVIYVTLSNQPANGLNSLIAVYLRRKIKCRFFLMISSWGVSLC